MFNSLDSCYKTIYNFIFIFSIAPKQLGLAGISEEVQREGPIARPESFTEGLQGVEIHWTSEPGPTLVVHMVTMTASERGW